MRMRRDKDSWNLIFTMGICSGVWTTLVYLMVS